MYEPLVSVIIPIYNTEKYITRAVNSVLGQTYQNFEIILVNDGSSDNSEDVCKQLVHEEQKIRYLFQKNQGVSVARNYGLENAKGEYIFFLDSDDAWKETLLQIVINAFLKFDCDMVRFNFESRAPVYISSGELESREWSCRDLLIQYYNDNDLYLNISSCCFGAYRKSLIQKYGLNFDNRLSNGEDGKFVLQYCLECKRIYFLKQRLYDYYPLFTERINATARNIKELYDEYELCLIQFRLIYDSYQKLFSEEEKQIIYGGFINKVIGRLVRFVIYTPYFLKKKNQNRLNVFLNDIATKEAIKYYKPTRKTDSRIIPVLLKNKKTILLWYVLSFKKRHYFEVNGRKPYIQSIWKDEPILRVDGIDNGR